MTDTKRKVNLTLYIDSKAEKVVFAEAGKDFVDFLFHILSLPVGSVVKLVKERGLIGCLSNLYESIENLSESYLQPTQLKNSILNPRSPRISPTEIPLTLSDPELEAPKVYACNSCLSYFADVPNVRCPRCGGVIMNRVFSYVRPSSVPPFPASTTVPVEGGFVKGLVSYLVTDNLNFIPISAKSIINFLNEFNVKDVNALEEMVVELGVDEGLMLLKLSLECKTVLTDAFIQKSGPKHLKVEP